MTRATTAAASFSSSRHILSDDSTVFNLRLWTHDGIWIDVAEMANECTASQCSEMLTRVLHRFIACSSDREIISLAIAIEDTLRKVAKA